MSAEQIEQIRLWQESAYVEGRSAGSVEQTFDYLGATIVVPPEVMPITPVSHLLGEAVLAETVEGDRVLDMGTGSGVNAILAAKSGARVLAVDVNDAALGAARRNVRHNEVADRVEVRRSDVFAEVPESFDLIIFDPPFRWFPPRDRFELASTDTDYRAMTEFFHDAPEHLAKGGRMLIFFGTSGDLGYLQQLMSRNRVSWEVVARGEAFRDGWRVEYCTHRVTPL